MLADRLDAMRHVAYVLSLVSGVGALFLGDLVHGGVRNAKWRAIEVLYYLGHLREVRGSRMQNGVHSSLFMMIPLLRSNSSALPRGDRHRLGDLMRVPNI
jgi:hypothetical protein